jgi:dynein heavy chain
MTQELLPTPSKSHYAYSLRDLAKVFEGLGFRVQGLVFRA